MNSRESILRSVKDRQKDINRIVITFHAMERIERRKIAVKDVMDTLKFGVVCDAPGGAKAYKSKKLYIVVVSNKLVTAYRRRR